MTNPLSIITEPFGSKRLIIPDLPVMSLSEIIIYFLCHIVCQRYIQSFWNTTMTVVRGFYSFPFRRCLHNIHIFLISLSHIAGIRADIHVVILSVGHFPDLFKFVLTCTSSLVCSPFWVILSVGHFPDLFKFELTCTSSLVCSPFWFELMRTWPRFHVVMAAA